MINDWLDTEKPDLVVLTGDQLNGQSTSWDPRSVLALYTAPLIARSIPYAVIFGNHDSEAGPLSRRADADHRQYAVLLQLGGSELGHGCGGITC